jgi:hypothetical protein
MSRRGLILFAFMSVIWGIPYPFIRLAVAEITRATLVFGRTVCRSTNAIGGSICLFERHTPGPLSRSARPVWTGR